LYTFLWGTRGLVAFSAAAPSFFSTGFFGTGFLALGTFGLAAAGALAALASAVLPVRNQILLIHKNTTSKISE
jgi:hypothetical protein